MKYGDREVREFLFAGRRSLLVLPDAPRAGNPWVWRAEFFGAFDTVDRFLNEQGYAVAYHAVSDLYGCPQSIDRMQAFYGEMTARCHLSARPALFGFSRGALYAVNFALRFPREVSCLYLDAPVLDVRSWPCACWASTANNASERADCMRLYGITEETLLNFAGSPLDHAEALAQCGIPVLIVAGLSDHTVPYFENARPFSERFARAGGELRVIEKPGCDHHPHSMEDPRAIAEWIMAHEG